jgi:hypothetical protein
VSISRQWHPLVLELLDDLVGGSRPIEGSKPQRDALDPAGACGLEDLLLHRAEGCQMPF